MLLTAFRSLSFQLIVISIILTLSWLIVWVVDGGEAARGLLDTAILQMKAPWVWTFGFGLASFVRHQGRLLPAAIDGILVPNEATAAAMTRIEQSTFHRNAWRYTLPLTVLGIFLTVVYGIPNPRLARVLIFGGVVAIYYIAGYLLFHFMEVTRAFQGLFESIELVDFRTIYSPLHLENLTTYLALTTCIGVTAIYAGFRGTVTASFEFQNQVWRLFLLTPLVLLLPGTLFYNYHPRYVLRKILQHRVFRTMEKLGAANELDAQKLVLSLKETAILDSQILPFLDYKTLPSYLIAILFAASILYGNDPAVKNFFNYLLNLGSK